MGTVCLDGLGNILRRGKNNVGIVRLDKFQPLLIHIADDDIGRMPKKYALQRTDSRRPRAEDQNRVVRLDLGDFGCPIAGGQKIAHQQRLKV